jgi:hypothetical protein
LTSQTEAIINTFSCHLSFGKIDNILLKVKVMEDSIAPVKNLLIENLEIPAEGSCSLLKYNAGRGKLSAIICALYPPVADTTYPEIISF